MAFEFVILDWFQNIRCAALDVLAVALSTLGDHGAIWIALALVMLAIPRTRRAGLAMALALIGYQILGNGVIKPLVARPRPCDINTAVTMLVPRPNGWSFPSGHSGSSFAAAFALWFQHSPLRWPAVIFASLMALSRLYLYVHFPTDVLTGALLGLALGWCASRLADAAMRRWGKKS